MRNHATPPFLIHELIDSKLWIMPAPTFDGNLISTLEGIRKLDISHLASLIEPHEIPITNLHELGLMCGQKSIELHELPMPDRQPPNSLIPVFNLSAFLLSKLQSGQSVGIHCKSGIGRSGIVAAVIMGQLGYSYSEVIKRIALGRHQPAPNTPIQLDWLQENWHQLTHET